MVYTSLVIFILLPFFVERLDGYPFGAPPTVCTTMIPNHRVSAQTGPAPFSITALIQPGGLIQVTIEDKDGRNTFRGFMLQAIDSNNHIISGKFSTSDQTKGVQCAEDEASALTHSSNNDKFQISTTWTVPAGFIGFVTFVGTVVQDYNTFWVNLQSNAVQLMMFDSPVTKEVTNISVNRVDAPSGFPDDFLNYADTSVVSVAHSSSLRTTIKPLTTTAAASAHKLYSGCGVSKGCFGLPRNCVEREICEVVLSYVKISSDTVRFELVGALGTKKGWIATGLSRNSKMGDDSVTECVVINDTVVVRESWNHAKPRKGNILLPETQKSINNEKGEVENGVVTCQWSRPVFTVANGIVFDLDNEKFHILLATGPVDSAGNKAIHTASLSSANPVSLTAAALVIGKPSTLIKLHGSLMTAAWIGLVSIAILLARHYKEVWTKYKLCGTKVWFSIHRCFMLLSLAFVGAGFIAIFIDVDGWSDVPNPHPILGCIATALIVMQPLIAACRPHPTSPKRPIFRWIHGMVGNGAQLVACVNLFFAVSLKESNLPQAFYWVLVTFIIFHCLVHLLIHIHSCFMERERERESNTKLHQFQFGDGYEVTEDAPGSDFKKFALGLYSMVNVGLTAALVLMVCLN